MYKQLKLVALMGVGAVVLSGCMSVSPDKTAAVDDHSGAAVAGQDTDIIVGGIGKDGKEMYLGESYSNSAPANQKYYYDLDSSEIHKEYMASIEAQAKYLIAHPKARVRLEGNTDERGSREYNIALGERRPDSVVKTLELLGVPAKQMIVVSYGEERPEGLGHDEMAYRVNRRVDMIYENKG